MARRRGAADPENHCAVNVALYGPTRRWTMTERGRSGLRRTRDQLTIGPSHLDWSDAGLTIGLAEMAVPVPRPVRGTIRLRPDAIATTGFVIDGSGRHRWRPVAPAARIEVDLQSPALRWSGEAYFDCNWGDVGLEQDFRSWTWSRSRVGDEVRVLYEPHLRSRTGATFALGFDRTGTARDLDPPPPAALPPTLWRMPRPTRCDADSMPRLIGTLEDAPFYARSRIESRWHGQAVAAFHESLSLDRFARPIVQAMLPFRMPRRAGGPAASLQAPD